MALPKLDFPTFKIFLNSQKREVNYRPFLVKEEKILLIALESGEYDSILSAVKQVLRNCILDDKMDVDELPLFDLEYMFLNIRAKSMGEVVELKYICENKVEDRACGAPMVLNVDLTSIKVRMPDQDYSNVKLTDKIGIKLKYPSIEVVKTLTQSMTDVDALTSVIEQCTEYIYDEDQVFLPKDMANGEFAAFVDNMTQAQLRQIQNFFLTMPAIVYDDKLKCKSCGKDHTVHLEGIVDFFD